MKKHVILCIDDERIVLNSLRQELKAAFGDEYQIEIAEGGEDALELFKELQEENILVPVIISDYIMPDMKGDELLTHLHALSPDSTKIMLTGQASVEGITNAINKAKLYRYIAKPWESHDFILTISEAIKSYYRERQLEDQNKQLKEHNQTLEAKVSQRTQEIQLALKLVEEEKEKSDNLLLNILPETIADELKEKGYATPKLHENASVLFSDFKNFTQVAEQLSPHEVISVLNDCFLAFDSICRKYHLEKIKTIGDAYMAVAGVPMKDERNAFNAVQAGLQMIEFIEEWKKERKAEGKPFWEVRVGIHTGDVIAGVIGKHKFAYDIWGDTVNTASRMESSGESGRLNISGITYQIVKDAFNCQYRGKVGAKNKGEIEMYFVDGPKT